MSIKHQEYPDCRYPDIRKEIEKMTDSLVSNRTYNVSEASRVIKESCSQVRRMCRDGRLSAIKMGKEWLIYDLSPRIISSIDHAPTPADQMSAPKLEPVTQDDVGKEQPPEAQEAHAKWQVYYDEDKTTIDEIKRGYSHCLKAEKETSRVMRQRAARWRAAAGVVTCAALALAVALAAIIANGGKY